ncbi:IclR family transcriptional regulator [Microbacterium sp. A93]|uniref:IclR family transcriptional regulator n=1 Tax=Microbacterium sp. A93 TaxID=3450716 RepID=UPI003F429216
MEQEQTEGFPVKDTSTTVDKAMRILEALADAPGGLALGELVNMLGTHRAPLYRILRSLEGVGYISRRPSDRRYELGFGLKRLAQRVPDRLKEVFEPQMRRVCREVAVTGMLNVMDAGRLVVRHIEVPPGFGFHLIADVGYSYGMEVLSAPVVAALSCLPAKDGEDPLVARCRAEGFAVTSGTIRSGVSGIGVPFDLQGSVGSVSFLRAGEFSRTELDGLVRLAMAAVHDARQG